MTLSNTRQKLSALTPVKSAFDHPSNLSFNGCSGNRSGSQKVSVGPFKRPVRLFTSTSMLITLLSVIMSHSTALRLARNVVQASTSRPQPRASINMNRFLTSTSVQRDSESDFSIRTSKAQPANSRKRLDRRASSAELNSPTQASPPRFSQNPQRRFPKRQFAPQQSREEGVLHSCGPKPHVRHPPMLWDALRSLLHKTETVDDALDLQEKDFDTLIRSMDALSPFLQYIRHNPRIRLRRAQRRIRRLTNAQTFLGLLDAGTQQPQAETSPRLTPEDLSALLVDEAREDQNRARWLAATSSIHKQVSDADQQDGQIKTAPPPPRPLFSAPRTLPPASPGVAADDSLDSHPLFTAKSFSEATRMMRVQEENNGRTP